MRAGLLLSLSLAAAIITAVIQWYGVAHSLYWKLEWWDIPAHVLGGFAVAAWMAAVCVSRGFSARKTLFITLSFTLAVAVLWELWEYYAGLTGGEADYWFDTIKDVIDDCIGAFAAFLIAKK